MTVALIVFLVVYLGMVLGDLPFLQIDRTGIAGRQASDVPRFRG